MFCKHLDLSSRDEVNPALFLVKQNCLLEDTQQNFPLLLTRTDGSLALYLFTWQMVCLDTDVSCWWKSRVIHSTQILNSLAHLSLYI